MSGDPHEPIADGGRGAPRDDFRRGSRAESAALSFVLALALGGVVWGLGLLIGSVQRIGPAAYYSAATWVAWPCLYFVLRGGRIVVVRRGRRRGMISQLRGADRVPSRSRRIVVAAVVALLCLAALVVWPTPWQYWQFDRGTMMRRHRVTGEIEWLSQGGCWTTPKR